MTANIKYVCILCSRQITKGAEELIIAAFNGGLNKYGTAENMAKLRALAHQTGLKPDTIKVCTLSLLRFTSLKT